MLIPNITRAFLMVTVMDEVAFTVNFDMQEEGRVLVATELKRYVNSEVMAVLVLSSVTEMVPPEVKVKLMTCIRILEARNRDTPEADLPF